MWHIKQEGIWTEYITRYCDLIVTGTRSKTMNKDSVEVDINCSQIGFDFLRKITAKAPTKFPVIRQAQLAINLMTGGAEELVKFKLKLLFAHYRSLPVANPDEGFNVDSERPLSLIPSLNFHFSMEEKTLLHIWAFVNLCTPLGTLRTFINGQPQVPLPPGAPPDSQPIYSKTYKDLCIYKGIEVNSISIADKLLRLTTENYTSIM